MEFIAPLPFEEAIQKLGDQSVVGSAFSSSEWSDLPLELRENAFFSSRVESARVLQRAQNLLGDFLAANHKTAENGEPMLSLGSRAAFVDQMQEFLTAEGVVRTNGGLTDITSEKRLGLIFDVKTRQAQDFGYWKQGVNPDVLNEFPAQRFIRVRDVKTEREAHLPYQDQVYLKTDPIWWLVINKDFGVPYGPWAFGCGHDVQDEDRDVAEELGLIKPGERISIPPAMRKFLNLNQNLQASVKTLAPELRDKLLNEFGDKIVFENDTIKWKGKPDERRGDSTSGRNDDQPAVDARGVAAAVEQVFRDLRPRDAGEPFDTATTLSSGAEISAVAEGRKPLYHEQWGEELGADLATKLWDLKLPNMEVQLRHGHLYVYNPAAAQAVIDADPAAYPGETLADKIQKASIAGTNGDLLGYGARTMLEPGRVLVTIFDGDQPVFGFFSLPEVAKAFGLQRTVDFERAYGRVFRYEISGLTS